jgi:hypothetical protein
MGKQKDSAHSSSGNLNSAEYSPEERLYPVWEGNLFGYIDHTGKMIISPFYERATYFYEGLAAVKIGNKFGFISPQNEFVIEPVFDDASSFKDGHSLVRVKNEYAMIDREGNLVFPFCQIPLVVISEGLLPVVDPVTHDKFGYADLTGMLVINPVLKLANPFSEGLAAVAKDDNRIVFIDTEGEVVIQTDSFIDPMSSDSTYQYSFSEGLCAIELINKETNQLQYGYIDKKGDVVIPPVYEQAANFHEGVAAVKTSTGWGIINHRGDFLIKPQYNLEIERSLYPLDLLEDFDKLSVTYSKWMCVSENSSNSTLPRFSEGKILFQNEEGLCGYMDIEEKVVIEPRYKIAFNFFRGLACGAEEEKLIYIDPVGDVVWKEG